MTLDLDPAEVTRALDRLAADDPRLQPLVELVKRNAAQRQETSVRQGLRQETLARIEDAVRRSAELEEENAFLRRRLGLLASALVRVPRIV